MTSKDMPQIYIFIGIQSPVHTRSSFFWDDYMIHDALRLVKNQMMNKL